MKPAATVVTGAGGGIGRALARLTAERHGGPLLLLGRSPGPLEETAGAVRRLGGAVETAAVDVRDRPALSAVLAAFDARHPVARAWVNAGVSAGPAPGGPLEAEEDVARLVETNLTGAIATVAALAGPMAARGTGRIGLVSSVAAIRPLPELATYSATKAGLLAYGEAIRPALAPRGVAVSVLLPGFVTSPMSARHLGPRPFEIPPERAARIMDDALAAGRAVRAFPWPMALLVRASRLAPRFVLDPILARFGAEIAPDGRTARGD